MGRSRFGRYLSQSLVGFGSLALAILFYFALYRLESIYKGILFLLSVLMPFIYGGVLAYILSPLCNRIDKWLLPQWKKTKTSESAEKITKGMSVAIAMLLTILLIYTLFAMVVPQLLNSIEKLLEAIPAIIDEVGGWAERFLASKPGLQNQIVEYSQKLGTNLGDWLQSTLIPSMDTVINEVSNGMMNVVIIVKNLLIGFVVAIYLLISRKLFAAQSKKLLYCIFPVARANWWMEMARETNRIFSGFISGKLLDSLLVGLICFAGTTVLGTPYAMLVSVIIGVTNIIPFFGPFIGGIPSALLILTVSPLGCLYFVIFLIIMQQIDGNILEPKILGGSIGISGFWVLFSLLTFSGLFGFAGMLIGVPTFAVLYHLFSQWVRIILARKKLPTSTQAYLDLDLMEEKEPM